jgi:hypothetical protein
MIATRLPATHNSGSFSTGWLVAGVGWSFEGVAGEAVGGRDVASADALACSHAPSDPVAANSAHHAAN